MTKPVIGIIGLGDMGEPMAARLLDSGYDVVSCANRRREPFERLLPKGLREVETPGDVGAECEILMSIVFDEPQNDLVLKGATGALAAMKPGSTILLMSTISPGYCQRLAEEAKAKGIAVLDCPLSGMRKGAEDGTLSLLIGGDDDAIAACRAPLEVVGNVMPCGDLGAGQITKLANNALFLCTVDLLFEVQELVRGYGLDVDQFMANLNRSTGRSFASEVMPIQTTRRGPHAMAEKDLSTCLSAAAERSIAMPTIHHVCNLKR